ncbi:hypothetical protein HYH03_013560 [Edaphochlamys debaryana]|uniref:Uncharacterized protein n=1 Tax=Edaphochlamys debaryana TaxID=47281 RepID=A0A836BUD1_9CHLO|nr:hypothetical protein HYH03_013560 [Edaphochlamys debaryana]|eukprot:KAG2487843.1 hypothetical protein HYH03_013560 [Edaphochlamys debaryana]
MSLYEEADAGSPDAADDVAVQCAGILADHIDAGTCVSWLPQKSSLSRYNLTACGRGSHVLLLIQTSFPAPATAAAAAPRLGFPVFRVRAVGPSGVWRQRVLLCSASLSLSRLELSHPGTHSVEVVEMYPDLSLCDVRASARAAASTTELPPGSPPVEPWMGFLSATLPPGSPATAPTTAPTTATATASRSFRNLRHARSAGSSGRQLAPGGPIALSWSDAPPRLNDATMPSSGPSAGGPGEGPAGPTTEPEPRHCGPYGLVPGRWEWVGGWGRAARAQAQAIARSCVWQPKRPFEAFATSCPHPDLQFNGSAAPLRWRARPQQAGAAAAGPGPGAAAAGGPCEEPKLKEFDAKACLARLGVGPSRRRLCLRGDSHSRYLAWALHGWATGFADPALHDCRGWDKDAPVSDFVAYLSDPWADRNLTAGVENCSVTIVNNGHWPASFQTNGRPRNPKDYGERLKAWLQPLEALHTAGSARVVLALTVAQPLQWRRQAAQTQDWRTEPILEQYNFEALRVASELGLPVLDLWGPSEGLPESAWDSSHYYWKSSVGHVLMTRAVAAICS